MDNPSAFPEVPGDFNAYEGRPGMTLRDWFAGQAVGAVVRQCAGDAAFGYPDGVSSMEQLFAAKAYAIADAMLAERAKSTDLDPIDTSVGGVE
ncbi:hypothetical protein [Sphingobium sp. UBA5915]|uniref:hypothetical protein n=1 Tax=Sphingobium sp. UBA5915 TaxID=1947530 RepID=UPI0025DFE30A|nr:hypothetical protein [Sphingobium sp. UBA5915]